MYLFILYQIHRVFLVRLANFLFMKEISHLLCSVKSAVNAWGGASLYAHFQPCTFLLKLHRRIWGKQDRKYTPRKAKHCKVLKWNIYKTHGMFQVCSQNEAFLLPCFPLFWCLYKPLLNFQWLTWQSDSLDSWFPSMDNTYIMSLFLLFTFLLCLMKINLPLPK